jgi:hypothetical protein
MSDAFTKVKENLRKAGYDGSLLKANDLLLAIDSNGKIMNNIRRTRSNYLQF